MTDSQWARPTNSDRTGSTGPTSDDLDWVRRRMIELDDAQRALPADDLAARHAIHEMMDDLRTMLRQGYTEAIHEVRTRWSDRAGRKGGHEVDYGAIAWMVRSAMPSEGAGS